MKRIHVVVAVLTGVFLLAGEAPVRAQALADLAKKAEDARKAAKKGTRTYTNADAGNVPAATAAPVPAAGAASPAPAAGATTPAVPAGDQAGRPAPEAGAAQKDQAYYGGRARELREALDRDTVLASAVQTQINSLTTDFVNRDDPAQRSIIEQNRNRALAELARLQKQIEADRQAIADFEEEARRAGVPPGWLR